ncbi:MAG: LamG domain-containing protein [Nocardioides sp.]
MVRGTRLRARLALASLTGAALLPALVVTVTPSPAQATAGDQSVSGVASPIWQPNAPVDALATANGVIYAGGNFTSVAPPAGGSGTATPRTYLAAFDATTGNLITSFNHTLDGRVYALDLSPDQKTLYVGGGFTTVDGASHNHVAAINLTTGAVSSTFAAAANRTVRSIESTASTVYIGGDFTTVKAKSRAYLASLSAATGALNTAFVPTFIQRPDTTTGGVTTTYVPNVLSIKLSADGTRLLAGGDFMGVNGVASGGMSSLDPLTGATEEWDANAAAPAGQPVNTSCIGRVTAIVTQGANAYVSSEGDQPGCYEGTYSATISTGSMNWLSSCLGAAKGLTIMNDILYKGSHQHDCTFNQGGAYGGFVGGLSRGNLIHHHLVGQNVSDGSFVHWSPNTDSSGAGATGPHCITNDGSQIIVGGDFLQVNGQSQTYLTRFLANGDHATPSVPGVSVKNDPFGGVTPSLAANLAITVQPTAAHTLTVLIPASEDADSGTLTYRVYRDGGATPVATLSAESYPWSRPTLRYDDTGLASGSGHTYQVTASDGTFTSALSASVSGTVSSAAPPHFSTAEASLAPTTWWPLEDSGSTAADASAGGATPGTFVGGVTTGAPGALGSDHAVSTDGTSGYITSAVPYSTSGAFSESAWFKTSTVRGGVIIAQSSVQTGAGGTTDKAITMDDNGDLSFTMSGGSGLEFRNQDTIWNDGQWHQVVGTYDGTATISLYVDGQLVGSSVGTGSPVGLTSGYLRVGYADMSKLQQVGVYGQNFFQRTWPMSPFWQGTVDEPSVFGYAVSPAQVQGMYAAGVGDASATTTTTTTTVVPAGATWAWKFDNAALPADWNSRTFDASGWASGPALLGFGPSSVVTDIDTFADPSQRPLTAYFTRQFQVPDASQVTQLTLNTVADDGIVVYVNGTEVGRTNMPSGTIGPSTNAVASVPTPTAQHPTFTVPTGLLVNGTNVISAETHLNYRKGANLTFTLTATMSVTQ